MGGVELQTYTVLLVFLDHMTKPYYALSPSIKWISHICTEREVKASISLSLSDQSLRPSNLLLLFFTSMVSSLESSWIHHTEQFGFVILTYTPSPTCWPHLCWYWILMHKIYAYIISFISFLGFVLKTNINCWSNSLDVWNSKRKYPPYLEPTCYLGGFDLHGQPAFL